MFAAQNLPDLIAEIDQVLAARPARRPVIATPRLLRAQKLIAARLPASEADLSHRLIDAGLTGVSIDLARIERASRFGTAPLPFAVLRREGLTLAVEPHHLALATTVYALAVRSVVNFGFALVGRVAFQSRTDDLAFTRAVVSAQNNFEWLDKRQGWFWFRNERSRAVKTIEKVLSVAGSVGIKELHEVLFRRFAPDNAPSNRALRTLCEQIPNIEVTGASVRLRPIGAPAQPPDEGTRLNDRERSVVELFRRWGPRIDGHRLPELCETVGLGAVALGRHLRASPLVLEPHPGVFRLIGT